MGHPTGGIVLSTGEHAGSLDEFPVIVQRLQGACIDKEVFRLRKLAWVPSFHVPVDGVFFVLGQIVAEDEHLVCRLRMTKFMGEGRPSVRQFMAFFHATTKVKGESCHQRGSRMGLTGGLLQPDNSDAPVFGQSIPFIIHQSNLKLRFGVAFDGQGQKNVYGFWEIFGFQRGEANLHLLVLGFVRNRGGAQEQGEEKGCT